MRRRSRMRAANLASIHHAQSQSQYPHPPTGPNGPMNWTPGPGYYTHYPPAHVQEPAPPYDPGSKPPMVPPPAAGDTPVRYPPPSYSQA
ncbi:hypothetical protein BD779DRAFT_1503614 [Infundibulicybe gibba]|nr:hypothetical protein BD779DRAFT_1503614 [Infundibulicybe gibba]